MTWVIDARNLLPRMLQTVNVPDLSPSQVDPYSRRSEVGGEGVSPLYSPNPAKPVTIPQPRRCDEARFLTSVSQVPCIFHS